MRNMPVAYTNRGFAAMARKEIWQRQENDFTAALKIDPQQHPRPQPSGHVTVCRKGMQKGAIEGLQPGDHR